MKKIALSWALVLAVGSGLAAAPAQAAQSHYGESAKRGAVAQADANYGVSPRKVSVNQSYELLDWWVNDSSGCLTSAEASLEHKATREEAAYDFTSGGLSGTLKFYDWSTYGAYQVTGTAWDNCSGDEVSIDPTDLQVKAAARLSLTADREGTGPWVTLYAQTKRYDGGSPRWQANRKATVVFQRKVDGVWRSAGEAATNSGGWAVVQFRRPSAAGYRAIVKERSSVWGQTSNTVRK